jgi:hypothetical protein
MPMVSRPNARTVCPVDVSSDNLWLSVGPGRNMSFFLANFPYCAFLFVFLNFFYTGFLYVVKNTYKITNISTFYPPVYETNEPEPLPTLSECQGQTH